jgi:Uma2 family endonuclease
MASVTATLEDYLKSDYEPDAEYVDGEIEERSVGELDHAAWQDAIAAWFRKHREQWNIRVYAELRVQVTPSRYRVPDVTVLDRNLPLEQIITRTPLAVFEVLSPEDTVQKLKRKLYDYQGMGIKEIWVVEPETGDWWKFVNGELVTEKEFLLNGQKLFRVEEIASELDK